MDDHEIEVEPCLVCYSESLHVGISPCGHNNVCGVCHLRLRHLHHDKKCPMCKTENEVVIVDQPGSTFANHPMWTSTFIAETNYIGREDVGMFFPTVYYHTEVLPLLGLACSVPDCSFECRDRNVDSTMSERKRRSNKSSVKHLQAHLKSEHRLKLCQLCVSFKRDFVSQLPRFSPTDLKAHVTKGDGAGSGFRGHPICHFCRPRRFYDLTQLQLHLSKDHYECHLCDASSRATATGTTSRRKRFYRNYAALERHFDRAHFLCQHVNCKASRFVVFENEAELRDHQRNAHHGEIIRRGKQSLYGSSSRRCNRDGSNQGNGNDDESVFQVWGVDEKGGGWVADDKVESTPRGCKTQAK